MAFSKRIPRRRQHASAPALARQVEGNLADGIRWNAGVAWFYHCELLEQRLVLSGSPVALAFAQPPGGALAGAILPPIAVNVDDSGGAIVTSDASTVTLTLSGETFTTGTSNVMAAVVNGVATFSNLAIGSAGIYTLNCTDGTLSSAASIPFNVYLLNSIASFSGSNGTAPDGALTLDSNGNLYGTTLTGGANNDGTVFEILRGSTAITTLATFNSVNGARPHAGLTIDSSGNLFGTTYNGGTADVGTVFEIAHAATSVILLASFNTTNGAHPVGGVTLDSSGNLFGTTQGGGDTNGDGTVFKIAHGSTAVITVASFNGGNGDSPEAALTLDTSGNLFGTTYDGGAYGLGTVFEVVHGTTAIVTRSSFNGANGDALEAGVTLDSSGNLFGTTYQGGPGGLYGDGTVFEIANGSTTVTTLVDFNGANGQNPYGGLTLDARGNFFGTTGQGGAYGAGTVFEIVRGTTIATTVVNFSGQYVQFPINLTLDASGDLFGDLQNGGASVDGSIFELTPAPPKLLQTSPPVSTVAGATVNAPTGILVSVEYPWGNLITTDVSTVTLTLNNGTFATGGNAAIATVLSGVATFSNLSFSAAGTYTIAATDGTFSAAMSDPFNIYLFNSIAGLTPSNGTNPWAGVTLDTSGNLFGTTLTGGANNDGAVFEIVHGSAAITTIASFNGANGQNPYDAVTFDTGGNLFGTTEAGGANGDGAVFEVAKGSTAITGIASFNGNNGQNPYGALTLDTSGNIFGTTEIGGAASDGTVFKIAHGTTTITTLASFNATNGESPLGGVILDTSGNLFGTTSGGGANSYGTVFEIVHATTAITTLASFNHANGYDPYNEVTLDTSGNLFGTTEYGGASNQGVVFEIVKGTSAITLIASFNGTNGSQPTGGVTLDTNGNLYSTTEVGGAHNDGTIFEIVIGSNAISTIMSFNGANGAEILAGLTLDTSGNLFGTAYEGSGATNYGGVFELTPTPPSLSFTMPPASTTAGIALNAAAGVQVSVLYSWGNLLATDSSNVTVTLNGGVFSTGSNTAAASAVNGIATINNLIVNSLGSYTLTASDGNYTPSTSASFTISVGPANQLAFTTQPASAMAGSNISPSVGVAVQDAGGNTVTTNSYTITLNLSNGAFSSGGSTATATTISGVATFNTLAVNVAGNYTLTAIDGTLLSAVSSSFNVYLLNSIASLPLPSNGLDGYAGPGLTRDSNDNLFGTTVKGGTNGDGTVFEIMRGTTTITTLATFNGANGAKPFDGVTLDTNGNIFGTAEAGGANGDGAIFEIVAASNAITLIASFNVANGDNPYAGLTLDSSGNLYGAALGGGSNNEGTIFEVVHGSSAITTRATFNAVNGESPSAAVTLDTSGNLFGITTGGGIGGDGTAFEIVNGTSAVTTLAQFNGANGNGPLGGVTLDSSGNIFGTTEYGGVGNYGTVFEIVHQTTAITPLASFNNANGANPCGTLTLDSSGNLFGMTYQGGASNNGALFEIVHGTSAITALASFNGTNGSEPLSGMTTPDSSGNIFGMTYGGGASGAGAVFALTPTAPTLSFVPPPTSTIAGAALGGVGGVNVSALYSWGNTVTSDTSAVTLTLSNGVFSTGGNTATTNAVNGVAGFGLTIDVPGTYTVTAADGSHTPITSAQFTITLAPNSVNGKVFNDANNNGVFDAGEALQAAVTVTLTPTGATTGSPVTIATAGDGYYIFANVNAGTYSVSQTHPAGYALTAPIGGAGTVSVVAGQAVNGPMFGDVLIASVTLGFNMLVALSQDYSKPGTFANGDLNGDGAVNFNDLVLLSQNYNHALPLNAYASSIAPSIVVSTTLASSTVKIAANIPVASVAATVQKPVSGKLPAPVIKPVIPSFTITSTRVTDPLDHTKDIVTFYARNNGVGATAGTRDVLAIDATFSSAAGLLIRTYDADGSGKLDDADLSGEHATPTASFIRIGGPGFLVVSTTPSANTGRYRNMQLVPGFEVAGTMFGGIAANSAGGTRIAVAVVKMGEAVTLAGRLAAEKGPLFDFHITA